jgi:hypothetical protein
MDVTKKVIKLKLKPDFDFSVFAISSYLNDYQISWQINKALGIDLKRMTDFVVKDDKNNISNNFTLYYFDDTKLNTQYSLISNKSEKGLLIREFSKTDFFLKIEPSEEDFESVIKKLRDIENVVMISKLTHELLSEKKQVNIFGIFTEF